MNWDQTMDCAHCGDACRYIGCLALTDHFRCRSCGADYAVDSVKGQTTTTAGESDAQRFAAALAKHKGLIARRGLP